MQIKNKATGAVFTTTKDVWENTIAGKGFAHKYDIVDEEKPIEIRQLSVELKKRTKK